MEDEYLEKSKEILENFRKCKVKKDNLEINPKGGFKIGQRYKKEVLDVAIKNILESYKELREKLDYSSDENKRMKSILKMQKEKGQISDDFPSIFNYNDETYYLMRVEHTIDGENGGIFICKYVEWGD